jgi:hypothetical protein
VRNLSVRSRRWTERWRGFGGYRDDSGRGVFAVRSERCRSKQLGTALAHRSHLLDRSSKLGDGGGLLRKRAPAATTASTRLATVVELDNRVIAMLYELRIYKCVPGRLPDLLKRFDTITLKLWEKHGIKQAGFWTTVIGESNQALYYMLKWESLAQREQKWDAFATDPEWLSARAQTEASGAIVAEVKNFILTPTSFSSVN